MVTGLKKCIGILFFCCAITSLCSAKDLIVDMAGVLSDSDLHTLESDLHALSEKAQKDVAVVIVQNTGDKTPQAYADDYFDYNNYGYGDENEGILLLIVTGDGTEGSRHVHISTTGSKTIAAVSDSRVDKLLDTFIAAFSKNNSIVVGITAYMESLQGMLVKSLTTKDILIGLAAGILVIVLSFSGVTRKYALAKSSYAYNSTKNIAASFDSTKDPLINTNTVTRPKPKANTSSSSSSSTHESSSGKTHGGGGRSF